MVGAHQSRLGWNFCFIGATELITHSYRPSEKAKVQAVNDLSIFSLVALSSLAAGGLQETMGWQAVNLSVSPLIALIIVVVLVYRKRIRAVIGNAQTAQ